MTFSKGGGGGGGGDGGAKPWHPLEGSRRYLAARASVGRYLAHCPSSGPTTRRMFGPLQVLLVGNVLVQVPAKD